MIKFIIKSFLFAPWLVKPWDDCIFLARHQVDGIRCFWAIVLSKPEYFLD